LSDGSTKAVEAAKEAKDLVPGPGVADLLKRQRLVPDLATLTQAELKASL
jgi:hypothetical protein